MCRPIEPTRTIFLSGCQELWAPHTYWRAYKMHARIILECNKTSLITSWRITHVCTFKQRTYCMRDDMTWKRAVLRNEVIIRLNTSHAPFLLFHPGLVIQCSFLALPGWHATCIASQSVASAGRPRSLARSPPRFS